jgi:hypothetical protein
MRSIPGSRALSVAKTSGTYSCSQKRVQRGAFEGEDHDRRRAPRAAARHKPRSRSGHWWIVIVAIAASKLSSSNGSASATPITAGVARCARMAADGSTATT